MQGNKTTSYHCRRCGRNLQVKGKVVVGEISLKCRDKKLCGVINYISKQGVFLEPQEQIYFS